MKSNLQYVPLLARGEGDRPPAGEAGRSGGIEWIFDPSAFRASHPAYRRQARQERVVRNKTYDCRD